MHLTILALLGVFFCNFLTNSKSLICCFVASRLQKRRIKGLVSKDTHFELQTKYTPWGAFFGW